MLLTVLGEFVLPDGGAAWTSTLVGALSALGIEEPAARQALARSSNKGLLRAERHGRRTRWWLTKRAQTILTEGAARIYSFGLDAPIWDGSWLLVLLTVPEENRRLRAQVKNRMNWLGFGSLAPGTWVTPWAEREEAASATLAELGLTNGALSWRGQPGMLGSVQERIGDIWSLDSIAGEYRDFLASTEGESPVEPEDKFAALTRLVHDWRHFPAADPGLPRALLPDHWPGPHAAGVFHRRRAEWSPAAWDWWRQGSQSTA